MFLKVACWATFVSLSMMAILHLYSSDIQKAVVTPSMPAPTMMISNFGELCVKIVNSLLTYFGLFKIDIFLIF